MKSKRGFGSKWSWIVLAIFFVAFLIIFPFINRYCVIDPGDVQRANESLWEKQKLFVKQYIFDCDREGFGFFQDSLDNVKGLLGFNESFYDFIWPNLVIGLLAGFWIWLAYTIVSLSTVLPFIQNLFGPFRRQAVKDIQGLRNSWLAFLGDGVWKIILIGVAYSVIMMIPLINSFINLITFAPLLSLSDSTPLWVVIIRSFIVAFYIGFLPGGIEAYTNYRLRKKYYEKIIRAKYRAKGLGALLDN